MAQDEVQEMLEMFTDGSGFGDPEARRNAELRSRKIKDNENKKPRASRGI